MQTKRILYAPAGGGVAIITPGLAALKFATIEQIATKDVPTGMPYWIVDASATPADRTFRAAWELPVDMPDPDGYGSDSSVFPEEVLS